jgi:ATP-dependent DNA ligase
VDLPDEPMLAAPTPDWALPDDGSIAGEPKWDGFRALAGRYDDGTPVIRSRKGTNLAPFFPDVAAALTAQLPPASLVDGELLVWAGGRLAFDRLSARLNRSPPTVAALAAREPASLMVFDVPHLDGRPLMALTYRGRRAVIEELFAVGSARPPEPVPIDHGWDNGTRLAGPLGTGQGRGPGAQAHQRQLPPRAAPGRLA